MKFTSIFFTASENIFEVYLKDTKKRARKPTISHPLYEVSKTITDMGSLPDDWLTLSLVTSSQTLG